MLTSRERLLAALGHKEPDHVPFDLGSTVCTGIHNVAYRRLRKHLGLPDENVVILDKIQGLADVSPDLLQRLKVDTRGIFIGAWRGFQAETWADDKYDYHKDIWGITWRKPIDGGFYYDVWGYPLRGDDPAKIDSYQWPDPLDSSRWAGLKEKAIAIKSQGFPVVYGSSGVTAGLIQQMQWLQGYEEAYINLGGSRAFSDKFLDKLMELDLAFWDTFLTEMGEHVDVLGYYDDYAGQHGLLISPEMIDYYFRPRYKRIFDLMRRKAPNIKPLFHCCGAVAPFFIEFLIDIGVEILTPVQVSADGMDTKLLKTKYGKDIVFWGGGVDTQKVLPRGTESDVREEVKRRLDDLMPGGGFVFNTVHNIQADVPAQNIMAMWETLQEYGKY